ncbi:MAG: hypothetical protein ACRDE8_14225 [Ginsengibacter sp.]
MKPILLYSIAILLTSGCTKRSNCNGGNMGSTDAFPNKVGDTWVYKVSDTLDNGNIRTVSQYNMNVSITGTVTLPGGIMATTWVYDYLNTADTNYVYQTGDTIKFLDATKSYPVRQYIIPIMLHNSWQYIPGVSDVTIIEQGNISVGGNNFPNAFHLNGSAGLPDAIFEIDEWIENNVGVVKRYINPSGELIIVKHYISWSLISYHLV